MPLSPNQRHRKDIKYYDMKCFLCRKAQVESATCRRKPQKKDLLTSESYYVKKTCPLTPGDSIKTTGKHQILTQSGGKVGATGSWGKYKATHLSRSTQKHNDRKSQAWTPSGRATSRTGNTHTRKKTNNCCLTSFCPLLCCTIYANFAVHLVCFVGYQFTPASQMNFLFMQSKWTVKSSNLTTLLAERSQMTGVH